MLCSCGIAAVADMGCKQDLTMLDCGMIAGARKMGYTTSKGANALIFFSSGKGRLGICPSAAQNCGHPQVRQKSELLAIDKDVHFSSNMASFSLSHPQEDLYNKVVRYYWLTT